MNISSKILTIIICTYNRNKILSLCIEALVNQSCSSALFQVLIVDNYQNQKVSEEIKSMISDHPHISLVTESKPGLSIARNTGAKEVESPWVAYIDDDCLVPSNFVEKALFAIQADKYDCFGGPITSWWLHPRPRWIVKNYGTKPILSKKEAILTKSFNWGGNIFFRKKALLQCGGFDENIGMTKNKIGYSAENRVQIKMREKGFIIGYIPSLTVKHLVAKHKLKLMWHLKAAYAEGRDAKPVFPEQYTLLFILKDILRIPKILVLSIYKWFSEVGFYWENVVLEVFRAMFKSVGKVKALFVS